MIDNLTTKLFWARQATWWSYALYLLSMLSGAYLRDTPLVLVAIATLPLLLVLPGMVRENHKILALLCFVALFYFIVIVLNLWSPRHNMMDWISVVLISILFTAAMLFSRWAQYAHYSPPAQRASEKLP